MKFRSASFCAVTLFLAAFSGCGGDDDPAAPVPHGKLERRLAVDGIERSFLVHVPESVDGSVKVPAVFMIHGTSGSGERFYAISGWVEKADREGIIAVFPSALSYCLGEDDDQDGSVEPTEFRITTKWAAGELGGPTMPLCSEDQISRLPAVKQAEIESRVLRDDVAFFDAIVASIIAELPVDPDRMYVTGFSNGGQMAARLMIERSETFAAFALAAGGPAVAGTAARAVSAVLSVGSLDDGFLARTGVEELPLDETLADIPVLRGMVGGVAGALRLDANVYSFAANTAFGKTVPTFTFDQSTAGADNRLVFAVIEDATHQYPNGTNHPVVMADVLWQFFSQYSLP